MLFQKTHVKLRGCNPRFSHCFAENVKQCRCLYININDSQNRSRCIPPTHIWSFHEIYISTESAKRKKYSREMMETSRNNPECIETSMPVMLSSGIAYFTLTLCIIKLWITRTEDLSQRMSVLLHKFN